MGKDIKLAGQPIICQLLSFLPSHIISAAVALHRSDYYYKTMHTYKHLVCIVYGVITGCRSLQALCKTLILLQGKLSYLGIYELPAVSTLSDANIRRNSDVFGDIYRRLYEHYKGYLSDSCFSLPLNGELDTSMVRLFDATTVTLFVEIFKGAGRNPINGKRKGGLKIQAQLPFSGFVPDLIVIKEAASNDKTFLGQLKPSPGTIYVFDKGYMNFSVFNQWTMQGVYFVTRINENAAYKVIESKSSDITEYISGGVILDQIIELKLIDSDSALKVRLVTYKDPLTGTVLQFLTNMFGYQTTTIAMLYKNRWSIETFFKSLKQNFELSYFYSDNPEGIKTQIWVALIANLIFTVIHKQIKECEQFTTVVSMAAHNLGSYICLISLLKMQDKLRCNQRKTENYSSLEYTLQFGGLFNSLGKSP